MINEVEGIGKEEENPPAEETIKEVIGEPRSRYPEEVRRTPTTLLQHFALC